MISCSSSYLAVVGVRVHQCVDHYYNYLGMSTWQYRQIYLGRTGARLETRPKWKKILLSLAEALNCDVLWKSHTPFADQCWQCLYPFATDYVHPIQYTSWRALLLQTRRGCCVGAGRAAACARGPGGSGAMAAPRGCLALALALLLSAAPRAAAQGEVSFTPLRLTSWFILTLWSHNPCVALNSYDISNSKNGFPVAWSYLYNVNEVL